MRRRESLFALRMPLYRVTSSSERDAVTISVLRLMKLWELDAAEQCAALGLYPHSQVTLKRFSRQFPRGRKAPNVLYRAALLLSIHADLSDLFYGQPGHIFGWMRSARRDFDGRRPIDVIREHGMAGLEFVSDYVYAELYR